MTLELTQVIPQIEQAVQNLRESSREQQKKLESAVKLLSEQAAHLDQLKEKLRKARTTWLVAELDRGLSGSYPLPSLPADYAVLGVDGSNIDLDRHSTLSCYLLNMGLAYLSYGSAPDARLESYARLYSAPEEMVIKDPGGGNEEKEVNAVVLGIKRQVEECALASRTLQASLPVKPTLCLFDGSLILLGLTTQDLPPFVFDVFLKNGFLTHLDQIRQISRAQPLSLASYISYPGGSQVVNVLRVAACTRPEADCKRYCNETGPTADVPCAIVTGLSDRQLFQRLLQPGRRSDIFASRSSIVTKYYGPHRVHFFYVNTGDEIARVEVPEWVAENPSLLDMAHAAIHEQCRIGRGYPIALQEAHERAVVTVADREAFRGLITRELMKDNIDRETSLKNSSKRMRWL